MPSQKLQIAWDYYTSRNEGGWSRDTRDPGNRGGLQTYCGITQLNYPHLTGIWSFLDAQTYVFGKVFPELHDQVLDFYDKEFWTPLRAEEINDTGISSILFDTSVNKGMVTGIEETQLASGLPATGHMDDATINGINNPIV
jgi:lysozyme family protein